MEQQGEGKDEGEQESPLPLMEQHLSKHDTRKATLHPSSSQNCILKKLSPWESSEYVLWDQGETLLCSAKNWAQFRA